jgi:protein tyrosine phosphatase (PTP) superfamily phosphohydrolase (DUF442 family)
MTINRVIPILNFVKLSISNILRVNLMSDSPGERLRQRIEDIYNFLQLSDRMATAGQPTIEQYPAIANTGYQVVINLALKKSLNAIENEDAIATNLGLEYIHIPVLWETPTIEDFQAFVRVMDTNVERKILIHCAANMRVSAFVYLYRQIYLGVDEATARQDLVKIWTPNDVWQIYIDRILSLH